MTPNSKKQLWPTSTRREFVERILRYLTDFQEEFFKKVNLLKVGTETSHEISVAAHAVISVSQKPTESYGP